MMRLATQQDLEAIFQLYLEGIEDMKARGLHQWKWGSYPNEAILKEDVEKRRLYVMEEAGCLLSCLALTEDCDPQYSQVSWRCGCRPAFMHRLVVNPAAQGKGVGRQTMTWVLEEAARTGHDCLRLDTSILNEKAAALYERIGMQQVGQVFFDAPSPYLCFEKPVVSTCPLLPIAVDATFRFSGAQPWGGDQLKALIQAGGQKETLGEALRRLAQSQSFVQETLAVNGPIPLPSRDTSRILFSDDNLLLYWEGDAITLKKKRAVLLPAGGATLSLRGVGSAIIAAPRSPII